MAEHDIEKIVEAGGEVFNFRDPTKQPVADRVTSWSSTPSDTKYPSEKLVKDSLDGKINTSDVDAALSTTSTNPLQNKELTRWHNIVLGDDGYFSGSSALPQLSLVKSILGSLSLYNAGVNVKIYSFDENDEDNATLEWDSANASGTVKTNFNHGQQTGTLFTSAAGKWVKITYTGSTSAYFRGLGIFMNTRGSASSNKNFYGRLRAGTTEYPWSSPFLTSGSLVTTVYSGTPVTTAHVILKPISSDASCAIFGFRCLNTYNGSEDAVLIGTSSFAYQLRNSRKLAVSLSNTSTDTSFNGTADVTNIKTTGTLGVGNGGTGKTTAKAAEYNLTTGKSEISDTTSGDDRVVFELASPSESNGVTRGFRKLSTIWTWIKGLLSSESGVNISGTAATAKAYDTSFSGTNSIASKFGEKQNLIAWDADADTYNASTNRAATVDSVVKRVSGKADDISFTDGSSSGSTAMSSKLLCGIKTSAASLGSTRLSFCMYITINRSGDRKGGVLCGTIDSSSTGYLYIKELSLTAQFGGLSVTDFVLLTGKIDGKASVGVAWNGTLDTNRYIDARVLDFKVDGGTFVYDVAVTDSSTAAWTNAQQNATDSDVVHRKGDETIEGTKTFSNTTAGNDLDIDLQSVTNNGTYKMGVEIADSGRRGLWDYNGTGIAGEGKWIVFKDVDNVVHVGDDTAQRSKVKIGGITLDFSGTIGSASDTLYIG